MIRSCPSVRFNQARIDRGQMPVRRASRSREEIVAGKRRLRLQVPFEARCGRRGTIKLITISNRSWSERAGSERGVRQSILTTHKPRSDAM
jgi:hypothetical protein